MNLMLIKFGLEMELKWVRDMMVMENLDLVVLKEWRFLTFMEQMVPKMMMEFMKLKPLADRIMVNQARKIKSHLGGEEKRNNMTLKEMK